MIKKVLAISGKPGLYMLISRGNKSLIVETIDEQKKRIPAFGTDRVVSLGDISIYTNDDNEVSLASVFQSIKDNYDGKAVDLSPKKADQDDIIAFFAKVLPNYDTDRVRVSDMRKVLSWYNILITNGIDNFELKDETPAQEKQETEEAAAPEQLKKA
ncbi:MAG: DUF5606 domain-containing protein [Bacteroidaceae bacterium]|nr:DUF5606 domain-containing protein [Bacteroidaceae bacterium]MBR1521480.1 DUF5606 domain-containing protein [Bacteroidaceae bacterium]